MDSNFSERYLNSLKNGTCPFCGNGLVYNRDYTESQCLNPKCQYNESIDFTNTMFPNKKYKEEILAEWVK